MATAKKQINLKDGGSKPDGSHQQMALPWKETIVK